MDFNVLKKYTNMDYIQEFIKDPLKLYKLYAENCTKLMWSKTDVCCCQCNAEVIQQKYIFHITDDKIYANVYRIDEILYAYHPKLGLNIRCSECMVVFDCGEYYPNVILDKNLLYLKK